MRSITYFIFCTILLLQYKTAHGKLGEIFQKIHETGGQIRQDIRDDISEILHLNDKNKEPTEKHSVTTSEPTVPNNEDTKNVHPGNENKKTQATPSVTTPATNSTVQPNDKSSKNTTGDNQDGRENFAGGCVAGYLRTADGRCKPTF